jgi:hypothetical protein
VKYIYSILFLSLCFVSAAGQRFSIAADKMNVLYADVDNPLTIAVENYPSNSIIVKTDNGIISGGQGSYVFRSNQIGKADITLYKKVNGKLKQIGKSSFRVKLIPDPTPKVGPSAGGKIQKIILKSQQYIRADYAGIDIDINIPIDSFTVTIIRGDTCISKELKNYTNKFSKELTDALAEIKQSDIVIFKDIYSKRYNGETRVLEPIFFFIRD